MPDNYSTTFASYEGMRRYHEKESLESRWHRCRVNELHIEPLDKASPIYGTPSAFAAGISAESVEDTAENLGLAMRVDGSYYPVRSTAYKKPVGQSKISGSALPKLSRQRLASVLNDCLELYSSETLLLIRDEKISAAHSGDSMDYSVLPIDELLKVLTKKLDDRFPGSMFQGGYRDHSLSSASWTMPGQRKTCSAPMPSCWHRRGNPHLLPNSFPPSALLPRIPALPRLRFPPCWRVRSTRFILGAVSPWTIGARVRWRTLKQHWTNCLRSSVIRSPDYKSCWISI